MVVSLGHSMASLDIAERSIVSGASLITHLFNAMLPVHRYSLCSDFVAFSFNLCSFITEIQG